MQAGSKAANMVCHLRILREFQKDHPINMPSDCMPAKLDFNKPFCVKIPERDGWSAGGQPFERGSMVWYPDGSRTKNGVGVGIFGNGIALSKSLGTTATIFQAEVHAIELCANLGLSRGLNSAKIYRLSGGLKGTKFSHHRITVGVELSQLNQTIGS